MAFYAEEEEKVWKCPRHPSKRHRTGVCSLCLRERLSKLCPDCANTRPCSCCSTSSTSDSSSSSSSSFSDCPRISSLIDAEPSFRRSKSAAVSRFAALDPEIPRDRKKSSSIWPIFSWQKLKRERVEGSDSDKMELRRSRSVAVAGNEVKSSSAAKWRAWYFPSPIKIFRQSKAPKVAVH